MIDITKVGYDIFKLDEVDISFLKEFESAHKRIAGGNTCLHSVDKFPLIFELDERTDETYNAKRDEWLSEYGDSVYQSWFNLHVDFNHTKVIELLNKIFSKYYSIDTNLIKNNFSYTLFNKGSFIKDHTDGGDASRIAGILIYLNENYDKANGGCLIVTDTNTGEKIEVIPELGNVVVLDYTKNQIPHEVTKVMDGERYAICNFIHYN
jgi:Rps23 Pro-64 3,4-dihydroxylase Tpa1-like proline 4-hydroxylase